MEEIPPRWLAAEKGITATDHIGGHVFAERAFSCVPGGRPRADVLSGLSLDNAISDLRAASADSRLSRMTCRPCASNA